MARYIEVRRYLQTIDLIDEFEGLISKCVLSHEDKLMLRMRYLRGMNFSQIAEALNYSETTIKSHHKKALEKIAKAIEVQNEKGKRNRS